MHVQQFKGNYMNANWEEKFKRWASPPGKTEGYGVKSALDSFQSLISQEQT
jgi:hypothetical protein